MPAREQRRGGRLALPAIAGVLLAALCPLAQAAGASAAQHPEKYGVLIARRGDAASPLFRHLMQLDKDLRVTGRAAPFAIDKVFMCDAARVKSYARSLPALRDLLNDPRRLPLVAVMRLDSNFEPVQVLWHDCYTPREWESPDQWASFVRLSIVAMLRDPGPSEISLRVAGGEEERARPWLDATLGRILIGCGRPSAAAAGGDLGKMGFSTVSVRKTAEPCANAKRRQDGKVVVTYTAADGATREVWIYDYCPRHPWGPRVVVDDPDTPKARVDLRTLCIRQWRVRPEEREAGPGMESERIRQILDAVAAGRTPEAFREVPYTPVRWHTVQGAALVSLRLLALVAEPARYRDDQRSVIWYSKRGNHKSLWLQCENPGEP